MQCVQEFFLGNSLNKSLFSSKHIYFHQSDSIQQTDISSFSVGSVFNDKLHYNTTKFIINNKTDAFTANVNYFDDY